MKNLILPLAMTVFLFIASNNSLFANGASLPDEIKAKATSTVVADQPGAPKQKAISEKQRQAEAAADNATDPNPQAKKTDAAVGDSTSIAEDSLVVEADSTDAAFMVPEESEGFYKSLKKKFIEGNAGFMSLVALALVLGLAVCIERILYLGLSEINMKKFMADYEEKIKAGDIEGAKELCRETRGPIASICYQGTLRINKSLEDIERSINSYGSVQVANFEKGCSWITLFIAIAPSLGFLGTVIGMVMAFDQIQMAGDINPTVVAAGMKVALITTIFGIIVALILQLFYNYILSKIENLTAEMEEAAITLLDIIAEYKQPK